MGLGWPHEIGVSWHVLWATEGLGGLSAGHSSSSGPSLPSGLWDTHSLWFFWACHEPGEQGHNSTPHKEGASCFWPASD